jgi:hypothetical protein
MFHRVAGSRENGADLEAYFGVTSNDEDAAHGLLRGDELKVSTADVFGHGGALYSPLSSAIDYGYNLKLL